MKNLFRRIQQHIYYSLCHRRAQQLSNQLNSKVYCIKVYGRPRLITRADIQHLKAQKVLPKSFTALDLQRICLFYVTPKFQ